jgi:hypothetical protein
LDLLSDLDNLRICVAELGPGCDLILAFVVAGESLIHLASLSVERGFHLKVFHFFEAFHSFCVVLNSVKELIGFLVILFDFIDVS